LTLVFFSSTVKTVFEFAFIGFSLSS